MSRYIHQDTENMLRGPYEGENLFEVADEDPDYLKRLLEGDNADTEDRELICKALGIQVGE